jgi:2,4-dichlorophenol 6-monooxygenase
MDSDGAILVRPDRFIGWRSPNLAEDPRRELTTALSQILGRPIDAGVFAGAAAVAVGW